MGCDAVCSTVEVDEQGAPLTVGRATRTVPPSIRRALMVRDRGCCFPGCDRPPAWTDGHHLVHWADGGETSLENIVLLCRPHHRLVHEEGWTLRRDEGGEIVATPP
jgi:5-methylcytosine-specific restriction endonuclease McrA